RSRACCERYLEVRKLWEGAVRRRGGAGPNPKKRQRPQGDLQPLGNPHWGVGWFTCLNAARTRGSLLDGALRAAVTVEDDLADANGVGSDLDDFVRVDVLHRAFDGELTRRLADRVFVFASGADVGQLLFADDIHVEVVFA